MMNLNQLENFLKTNLDFNLPDSAINGVQVENQDRNKPLQKIITAVDCSMATLEQTVERGGDVLLVHHGIYWGRAFAIKDRYYRMIKKLLDSNLALVAVHLPLDADLKWGNNIDLINRLALKFVKTFGDYKGVEILFKAEEESGRNFSQIVDCYRAKFGEPLAVVGNESAVVKNIGLCSGGGLFGIEAARQEGCDTFITGDTNHTVYHEVREAGMNLICGGHYLTEMGGVQNLGKAIEAEFGVIHEFVNLPTGL